jgi:hypothetical protein
MRPSGCAQGPSTEGDLVSEQDKEAAAFSGYNRRGSKDSQLR